MIGDDLGLGAFQLTLVFPDWERSDSNREPRNYEFPALTVELRSRGVGQYNRKCVDTVVPSSALF